VFQAILLFGSFKILILLVQENETFEFVLFLARLQR